jgi:hypothetical protein
MEHRRDGVLVHADAQSGRDRSHVRFGGVENLLGLDSIIARGLHDPSEVLNAKVDFVPLVEKGRGKMWRHRCARTSLPMDQH